MSVLERYSALLEKLGEDSSQIESEVDDSDMLPYGNHTIEYSFGNGNRLSLDLCEFVESITDVNFMKQNPFFKRSLSSFTKIIPYKYYLGLDFCYGDVILEHAVGLDIDPLGRIMSKDKEKSSFDLDGHALILKMRFNGVNTSVGADFEPVAKAMINCYKSIKVKPEFYAKRMV